MKTGAPVTDDFGRQLGSAQATGLNGADVRIVRAYRYPPTKVLDGRTIPRVAVDVDLKIPCSTFDPDDLELVDAESGKSLGYTDISFRMTEAGDFADWRDPVFTDPHRIRALFTYVVENVPRQVGLRYWERDLAPRAEVTATGPTAPDERQSVLGWTTQPTSSGTKSAHLVYAEATSWPRSRTPLPYLKYQLAGKDATIIVNRWVEVDQSLRPISIPLDERPFYPAQRRFVMQFVTPKGAKPTEVEDYGILIGQPSLKLPTETTTTLLAAGKQCSSCEE